jgi:hypothetical protein
LHVQSTVVVLEGGYNVPIVARGMEACVAALLGVLAGPGDGGGGGRTGSAGALFGAPSKHAMKDIEATRKAHEPFWQFLKAADA